MRYVFDQFELDTELQRLADAGGRSVALRPQAFRVLAYLIERAPAVVSRKELLAGVWGHEALSASGISQAVREIRRALCDNAAQPRIIATRHGFGYQIVTRVLRADAIAESAPASPRVRSSRRLVSGLILAVLLVGLGAGTYWSRPPHTSPYVPFPGQAQWAAQATERAALPSDSEAKSSFLVGERYLEEMHWKKAIEHFNRSLEREPDSSIVVLRLISAYSRAGFDRRARDLLNHPALKHSLLDRRQQLELRALIARTSADGDEVIRCLASLAEFFPEHLDYRFELFNALLADRPPEQAAKELSRIDALLGDETYDVRYMLAKYALNERMHQPAEALAAARLALDAVGTSGADSLRARAELAVGRSLARIEDWPASREALRRAAGAMRTAHDDAGYAEVLGELARQDLRERRLKAAGEKTSRACAIAESIGNEAGLARCQSNRAAIEIRRDRPDAARSMLAEAALQFERAGRMEHAAEANIELARLALTAGRLPEAEQRLALAAQTYERIGDRAGFAWIRHLTGNLLRCWGRTSEARTAHAEARTIFESIDLRRGAMASIMEIARLEAARGDQDGAMALFDQAAALAKPPVLDASAAISSTVNTPGKTASPDCPDAAR